MAVADEQDIEKHGESRASNKGRVERFLEHAVLATLVLFVLAAPHSIAVTQGAFILGSILWVARMIAARRVLFARTAIDWPLFVFISWTVVSVCTSIDVANSVARLRGVSLFFILYLFASNIGSRRVVWVLTLLLSFSVLGNLWWTYYDKARGRGLEITAMTDASPMRQWGLVPGDTILAVNGQPVEDLDALNAFFDRGHKRDLATIRFLRVEGELEGVYRIGRVQRAGSTVERLGIDVVPGRSFRSRGFFSHPATYAETLQMIAALCVGWVLAATRKSWRLAIGMGTLAVLVAGALIQTETRAPLVGFAVATFAMVALFGGGRKYILAAVLTIVTLVGVGGVVILDGRRIGFVDPNDGSTTWRLTVWREALPLIGEHPLFGIGPDAAKRRAQQLGLFDEGKLPPGHFHSTPIQIAVDRGVPALIAWLVMMGIYFVSIGRFLRRRMAISDATVDWRTTAAVLGAWGAVVGFTVSSFVHLNWMDSEAIEMAWALMGICYATVALDAAPDSER